MSTKKLQKIIAAFIICSIFLASSLLSGQESQRADSKSFLWKVQSKNNTVYILGSVHFLKKENYPLHKAIEGAFNDAKKLVLEIDIEGLDLGTTQQMMLKGMYDGDQTLQKSISKEAYTLVGKRARELGLDIGTLNKFEPWFAALTIAAIKLQKLGYNPIYGVDRYVSAKAKKVKKEILSLETFEYQIDLFDQMSPDLQELMLLQTLRDLDVMEKEVNRIVSSWASGDAKSLESILLESFRQYPEVYRRLVSDRNKNWLDKIENFLAQSESYMVVVGAGHLVGKEGVIELLKEKGYSVEQL